VSLNSLQRRHQWLVAPFHVGEILLTPERWPIPLDRAITRLSRALVFDTTALGAFLCRVDPLSPMRDRLLARSALLRSIDWKVRKAFWAMMWCPGIAIDLRPRRTPVPRREPPIALLHAPDSYPDFSAPTLVVPENVPCAEKSFGTRVGVQVLHLLQEIYPIVTTHQAAADPDPQKRFDQAYSLPYRLVRDKPVWHRDLVEAAARGDLLAALAVGGPFAKLLQRTDASSDRYVIDLEYLRHYPVREGLCHLGVRIEYVLQGRRLAVAGIRYDNELVTPQHAQWALTERVAQAALVTHVTVWRQGMEYHVGGLAAVPVLTHNLLPADHPLRRLLAPHFTRWITTSLHTHLTLRRRGFDVTGFSFPPDVILRYYEDGAAAFDVGRLDVEQDANRRGMTDALDYPYLPQALRYYRTFERYVRRYIDHCYPTEAGFQADVHPRVWFEALDRVLIGGVRRYTPDPTRDAIVKLCTLLMYSASVAHTENSLTNYAGFMPTTVRRDGRQQSVGEVQNTINFQLLIATPTTFLVADNSRLALDGTAAEIMRGFRRELLEIEQDMDAQPRRYWQLFPREVEASVSC
jgi:hypothetical protein